MVHLLNGNLYWGTVNSPPRPCLHLPCDHSPTCYPGSEWRLNDLEISASLLRQSIARHFYLEQELIQIAVIICPFG